MSQLADDCNFFSTYNLFVSASASDSYYLHRTLPTGLAIAVTKDDQGVKRKLWDKGACYCETADDRLLVTIRSIIWIISAVVPIKVVLYSIFEWK